MNESIKQLFVSVTCTLHDCIVILDATGKGIVLVTGDDRHLLGTVTDGDIRRAILGGINLESPVQILLDERAGTAYAAPLTAPIGTPEVELLHLMTTLTVRHIPLVDEARRVVDVAMLGDLVKEYELPMRAVVMAGGFGTRLRPLTEDLPKPMLPVGSRPLLELIVEQLQQAGIRQVNVATHYKSEMISEHFKDGRDFGVDIRYVKEDQPLGTAGALGLLEDSDEPLLVINGDILTRVDFRAMLDFHREHKAELTLAVKQHEFRVPYGVVETDGAAVVTGITEKPIIRHFINAGIYLLNPAVCRLIPNGQAYDIPDLISQLLSEGRTVVSFPVREYWLDIGKTAHYDQAQADVAAGRY
jgi:dTDP-glucose pyrophosphorylase